MSWQMLRHQECFNEIEWGVRSELSGEVCAVDGGVVEWSKLGGCVSIIIIGGCVIDEWLGRWPKSQESAHYLFLP